MPEYVVILNANISNRPVAFVAEPSDWRWINTQSEWVVMSGHTDAKDARSCATKGFAFFDGDPVWGTHYVAELTRPDIGPALLRILDATEGYREADEARSRRVRMDEIMSQAS